MTDILLTEDSGPVRTLVLNDPGKLNALSDEMLARLAEEIARLRASPEIRAVVIRGEGKAFCAGHDLRQMSAKRQMEDGGAEALRDLFTRCAEVMVGLTTLPQPVIASVHGIATAAGCQLVATADMAIAAEGTRFGVNGVNIGLFCSTPMVALTRAVPRKAAFEMLVTGEFVDASRAAELGLINRVVPHEALEAETAALASLVAAKLGAAVKIGKEAFYAQAGLTLQDAYSLTGDVMAHNMSLDATAMGIEAFLRKEKPVWDQ